jgi:hypothetical protein
MRARRPSSGPAPPLSLDAAAAAAATGPHESPTGTAPPSAPRAAPWLSTGDSDGRGGAGANPPAAAFTPPARPARSTGCVESSCRRACGSEPGPGRRARRASAASRPGAGASTRRPWRRSPPPPATPARPWLPAASATPAFGVAGTAKVVVVWPRGSAALLVGAALLATDGPCLAPSSPKGPGRAAAPTGAPPLPVPSAGVMRSTRATGGESSGCDGGGWGSGGTAPPPSPAPSASLHDVGACCAGEARCDAGGEAELLRRP